MKNLYTFLIAMLLASAAQAQAVEPVTVINYYGAFGLNPKLITAVNNALYFMGSPDTANNVLYKSDGTGAGTSVVKRVNNSITNITMAAFTSYNNKLVFYNSMPTALWSSDGTGAGTQPYAAVKVGTFGGGIKFVPFNGKLYFAGTDTTNLAAGDQLWVTDGTNAGTVLVKTVNSSGPGNIFNLIVANGKLYFGADDGVNTDQPWVSDGTGAGTTVLKIINPSGTSYASGFTAFNNKVYFTATDGVNGSQIWLTDGTQGGTNIVTHIDSTVGGFSPQGFTEYNGKLYFSGFDVIPNYQLYATDGTEAGTTLIKGDYSLVNGYRGFHPTYLTVYNASLYMCGFDSINGLQLWKTDGTVAGTVMVTNYPGLDPSSLTVLGNKLVFLGGDTVTQAAEVYVSDGTQGGSTCYYPAGVYGVDFTYFQGFVPFNGDLYFNASYYSPFDYQVERVVLSASTGINETGFPKPTIYPNPATNYLQINTSKRITTAQIIDLSGRIIMPPTSIMDNRIQISGLTPGLYLLQTKDEAGESYVSRFVKE